MIKCFTFENFKSFEKAELNIEAFSTLIGTNASGKSNAIEGISILSMVVTGLELSTILDGTKNMNSAIRGGSQGCTRFKTNAFKLGCLIDYDAEYDLLYEIKIGVNGKVVVEDEAMYRVQKDKLGPKRDKIFKTKSVSQDRTDIKVEYKNAKKGTNPDVICVRTSAILPQIVSKIPRDTSEEAAVVACMERMIEQLKNIMILDPVPVEMRDYVRNTDAELRTNCDNLSAVLNKICKEVDKKKEILQIIQDLPENEITDIEIVETKIGDVILALREKYLNSTELVDAKKLSDGTLRCLAMITAVLTCPLGSMIVIEEIDNGVHPGRVQKLLENLVRIGKERKIDIIVTTHNAMLLNQYKKDELIGVSVVYREKERGTSKFISFVDIQNFPKLLAKGGLGNALANNEIVSAIKDTQEEDYSWLGV